MSHAFSMDLRKRLVFAVDDGMTRRAAANRFGVSPSTAIRWVDQWRRAGHIEPDRQGGDNRSRRMEVHANEIIGLIEETPDITLAEIAEHLQRVHGLRVAQSTVWRLLDRHNMTLKKNRTRQRTATT